MPQTCPKCRRVNPADALYCYEDGFSLGNGAGHAGPVDPGQQPFPHPFVFPNGTACRNFDQLALACHNEWAAAVEMMKTGDLANFLAGLGRADLARAAREAARQEDKDHALDQLLGELPANTIDPAKLHVETLQVNLGRLAVGNDHRWELRLANQGMRLLSGTIACSDCTWLALGDGGGSPRKVFQFQTGTVIPVHVRGKLLRAAAKPVKGQLVIETNGGSATVVVTAEVPVKPFAEGALAGAITPRQIAEKAKASPKAAAPLFESGAVARWYIQNGWTYPVQGPSASGLGAVQQYFEALGLTTPPKVEVRESSLLFEGKPGAGVFHTLDVTAVEKRPVFASAVSDQPWLKVDKVVLDGRTAHVKLAVDSVPDRPGDTLQACVTVRANGNQRFAVPVALRVLGKPHVSGRRSEALFPALQVVEQLPIGPSFPTPAPEPARSRTPPEIVKPKTGMRSTDGDVLEVVPPDDDLDDTGARPRKRPAGASGLILPLLPVAFILFGLFITLLCDVVSYLFYKGSVEASGNFAGGATGPPLIAVQFHDQVKGVQLGTGGIKAGGQVNATGSWDPTMRFGLVMINQGDGTGQRKRLTFEEEGLSNNCCVRLDGRDMLYGEQPFRVVGEPQIPPAGRWVEMEGDLGDSRQGKRSVWVFNAAPSVQITQTVELVPGEQSGRIDTCLVRYRIENKDRVQHSVGLRFLLDTFIGANDGVPFLIPGQNQFCTTHEVMDGPAVPAYIQACEQQDLAHPGTIARLQLRLGDAIEPPNRVALGAYPSINLGQRMNDRRCDQEKTMWDVPVYDLSILNDSAVAMYWDPRLISAGGSRELGFTYGLGDVAAGEGGGKLGLSVGGAFTPGGEISVTAYVNNPTAGQTVTLTLPPGFQPADGGGLTRDVPAVAPGSVSRMSPVSWKVKAAGAGDYTIKVDSSNGASQSKKITIKARSPFGDN